MHPRLLLNFCERSLHRVSCGVRLNVKRLSHVAGNDEKRQAAPASSGKEIASARFPEYKVIYMLPFIRQASNINVVKYRCTLLVGAATPAIVGLCLTGILSLDTTLASITSGALLTAWLHTIGILCNNLVGYVYLKLDEEKAILSYIDYWGKRIDLEISANEILPVSDNPIRITDALYRKIIFPSRNQSLKINIKFGRIIDEENFRCILGMP
ncbi:PREDICTED: transmembrane protein 186 [Vollenhovia emeryi]|uniref:transmembrane protein 186 n=1 Tax=Vollenhovia emeryi TaxID=411798 RepID=UPI0005F4F494|nr:PREDICTED: transmembrane protein 186 [Vollenhovia emeryi]